MNKKVLTLMLTGCMLTLAACSSSDHSNLDEEVGEDPEAEDIEIETPAEEGVTEADLLDVREENTVEFDDGTVTFRLTQSYTGEEAENKLADMGEEVDDFLIFEDHFRFVLLEYLVKADSGFTDTPFSADELLGYDLWKTDLTETCQYYTVDLDANADLNYTNVTLNEGEESTVYALYEMPEDLDAFADCLTGKEQDYWFLYEL